MWPWKSFHQHVWNLKGKIIRMTGTSIPFMTRKACRGSKDQFKREMYHNWNKANKYSSHFFSCLLRFNALAEKARHFEPAHDMKRNGFGKWRVLGWHTREPKGVFGIMSETPLLSHLSRKDSDIFVDGESLSSAAKMHQERKYKNKSLDQGVKTALSFNFMSL